MEKETTQKEMKTRAERFWQVALTVLMLAAGCWGIWQIMIPEPAVAEGPPEETEQTEAAPATASHVSADTVDREDVQVENGPYVRKESYWTFLLVGMDKGGGNTDSLMIVTYDVANQKVSVASIARDTRVDVERKLKKINAAYAFGGIDELKAEVSKTFGIPIDFYVRANIKGFVRLVDAVDGVDFEVPCSMNYDDPAQNLSIHYSKGMRHLTGQQALEVCRFRQNNDGSGYGDGGRMQTQRGVMTALLKKVLAWNNVTRVNEFLEIAKDNLDTDLGLSDMMWFGTRALSFDTENLSTMSMPCEWINPYMYLDPAATLEMVNEYLNPYTTDRTPEMLDIITRKK